MNATRFALLLVGGFAVTSAEAQGPAPGPGPYVRAEVGYSMARDANFREDNPASPDCFLFVTGTTCGGTLNDLNNG